MLTSNISSVLPQHVVFANTNIFAGKNDPTLDERNGGVGRSFIYPIRGVVSRSRSGSSTS